MSVAQTMQDRVLGYLVASEDNVYNPYNPINMTNNNY